jgi:putative ABC transport system permease protein
MTEVLAGSSPAKPPARRRRGTISFGDLVASALRSLALNPLRSALTALGVIIGVASVIAMVTLGRGAQARIEQSINSLGSNLLIVVPGAQRGAGGVMNFSQMTWLTRGDAEAIAREVEGVAAVAPSQRSSGQIIAEGANWNTRIEGTVPAFMQVRDWTVASGRMFEAAEERQAKRVVLLGKTVAVNLFPNMDPVGQRVRINGGSFDVIGVLASKGQSATGQDQDDLVLAPLATVKRRLSGRWGRPDTVSQINVKAESAEVLSRVEEDVKTLLRTRQRSQDGTDQFTVQNLTSISEAAGEATRTFTVLLAAISAVSLLVGGIGIMNIMLVSVTERTREIGLRKALGARQGDILGQFALEAMVLSLAGGLLGLMIGLGGGIALSAQLQLPYVVSVDSALLAIGFSIAVGLVFGAYPAWRAARLDPIEALRRE